MQKKFIFPAPSDSPDLRPAIISQTYVLVSPPPLPTHPINRLEPFFLEWWLLAPLHPSVFSHGIDYWGNGFAVAIFGEMGDWGIKNNPHEEVFIGMQIL